MTSPCHPRVTSIAYRQQGEKASEVWLADTKTTRSEKLTDEKDDLQLPVRSQGFNADGSEVWLAGGVDRRLRRVRRVGDRKPRDFLGDTGR